MLPRFSLLLATTLLANCAVGPDYQRPETAVSDEWLGPVASGPVEAQWWASFGDPALTALVGRVVADNPRLAEARARVGEARALREAAQGGRLPQGGLAAGASENRISENGQFPVASIPGFAPEYSLFDVGFDASWEIDLWGATSRAIDSAEASEQAAKWAAHDVQLSLVAELARTYIEFRNAQALVKIASAEAAAAGQIAQLSTLLFDAGEANRTTADRAQSASDRATAGLNQAQAEVDSAQYRIAMLLGEQPGTTIPELQQSTAIIPEVPLVIAGGVRSELLSRRPDVRRAERELAAATSNVGVATAELYPSLTLMGGIGLQAKQPGDLTDGGSLRYSAGPGFSWPLFSLGRIRAQVRAADARADGAAARFEAVILSSLTESEDAANRYGAAGVIANAAAIARTREQDAFKLAQLREQSGEDSRLELEQARLNLALAERAGLRAHVAHAATAIALYKALGGGWGEPGEGVPAAQ